MRSRRLKLLVALALFATACGSTSNEAIVTTTSGSDIATGIATYDGACVACHGPEGSGIEGLGKPWVNSDFINSRTDEEMLAFLIEGRASDHPDNTTGISMMPRGGNPNLTDDDLLDLIAYMRTLNLDA